MSSYEVNFDGLVGPTHNYAGLAVGNIASLTNKGLVSNPKQAAIQGLNKAKLLADLGIKQAILPPQPRPNLKFLHSLGFTGTDAQIIAKAHKKMPEMLAACYSASSMWAANIATVSPSSNTADHRLHFTAANLISNTHRALEAEYNYKLLSAIFADKKLFCVHPSLLSCKQLGDEGAANHSNICQEYGLPGIELFVYSEPKNNKPNRFTQEIQPQLPTRQSLAASQAIANLHTLNSQRTIFAHQNPLAIAKGVFHNDVAFVANQQVVLCHQQALLEQKNVFAQIQNALGKPLTLIEIANKDLTMAEAVKTYLFNSQLVTLPNNSTKKFEQNTMALIAPEECMHNLRAKTVIENVISSLNNPINKVYFVDCRQSMQNGGGPACLRLRVVLTTEELKAIKGNIFLTDDVYARLISWVNKYYRDRLSPEDLADYALLQESMAAITELGAIFDLPELFLS